MRFRYNRRGRAKGGASVLNNSRSVEHLKLPQTHYNIDGGSKLNIFSRRQKENKRNGKGDNYYALFMSIFILFYMNLVIAVC